MTKQFAERLRYQGRTQAMLTEPLEDFIELRHGLNSNGVRRPMFLLEELCSALWRGYVGHWIIYGHCLYLVRLSRPNWEPQPFELRSRRLSLALFFPEFPDRVFAHWYSGTLVLPDFKATAGQQRSGIGGGGQVVRIDIAQGVVTGHQVSDGTAITHGAGV